MKKKTETALVVKPSAEVIASLRNDFPMEKGFQRVMLPRLGLYSQDVTEGKGKAMKVTAEAGTFYTDRETEEEFEGKKLWQKEEIGTSVQATILFQRKQLKFYDSATESYTSSPVYDTDDQIIPLFRDKKEVDKGTPKELQSREEYKGVSAKGKPISKLEENRILYVLMDGEIFQMNIRGTSMYAFMEYARKNLPPIMLTEFSSEAKSSGKISWNQMTFTNVRELNAQEVEEVQQKVAEIKNGVEMEKTFYANNVVQKAKSEDELDEF